MKALTREQVQSRKDKAVRFVRDVLADPDRADEIEDESLEDYAERRKFTITNPSRQRSTRTYMADTRTKAGLEQEIADLEQENQDLQDQLDTIADIVAPSDEDDDDDDSGDDDDENDESADDDQD